MIVFTIIAIFLIIILIIINYYLSVSDYWKGRNIKQVNGLFWKFVRGKQALPELIKEIYDSYPESPHVGIFLGTTPTLILRDLENIQAVLHGDFKSFYARGLITNDTDLLTDNLFFVEDYERWKLQRNKMSPFLTKKQIKNIFYVTERCARDFVYYIETNNQIFADPYNAIYIFTTACINSAVFGITKETHNAMETPINKIAYECLKTSVKFNLKFALGTISPKLYKFLNIKAFGDHEKAFIRIVKESLERRTNENDTCHNFIDTCLKFKNEGILKDYVTGYEAEVTLEFLAAQAFVFLIGGIDTTANVLHFTLLELSFNSKILHKLHQEIDKIFEGNEERITFEDLDKMQYMDMILNEVLRKYPPVGVTQRLCCKNTILPNGNVKVEKGTNLMIPIFALQRDAKYFPNPDVFDPERFSADNISNIVKNSYIAFGGGKRICIGIQLAFMQMKSCLAWFLRQYTLKEQAYIPKYFEPSFFAIRNKNARYEVIARTKQ